MTPSTDMSNPVTRGELREEIERLEIRLEQKLEEKLEQKLEEKLEQKLAHVATKADLEIWGGALMAELARHTKAVQESMSTQVSVIDEKYADLPGRVNRLEAKVFTPKRR
jgi:hypothetical protein